MKQTGRAKLSAFGYIKGNRKRVTALVVSLAMFVVLSYLVSYVLGSTSEPFYQACSEPYRDMLLTSPEISIGDYETIEEWNELVLEAMQEKEEEIRKIEGITGTVMFRFGRVSMKSVIGETTLPCFLMDNNQDIQTLLDYKNAKLIQGRMPEAPGEILVDMKLWNNRGNDSLEYMSANYKIVGQVESDIYLALGLALPAENDVNLAVFHPDDGKDYGKIIEDAGIKLYYVSDYQSQYDSLYDDIGSLDTVERLVQIITGVLLAVCLLVVLSLHIMDRHQEWCLMNSIGFSEWEIYGMALRELLFCFIMAIVVGAGLTAISGFAFNKILCEPIGIHVNPWRENAVAVIITVLIAIYGCCQIPLFINIRRVCTVDMIE